MKRILFVFLTLCLSVVAQAEENTQVYHKTCEMYMFAYSASYTDSIAYMTELQVLEPVRVEYNGFMTDRTLYAQQFDSFVQQIINKDPITVLYFSKSKKKAEKKYMKVRKSTLKRKDVYLRSISVVDFQFTLEEFDEKDK